MCTTKTHKSQKHIDHKSMILWSWDQNLIQNLIYSIDSNWIQLDQLVPSHDKMVPVGSTVGSTVGFSRCWPGMAWHNVSITWDPPWNPGAVRSSVESRDLVDICHIYVIYMSFICHIYICDIADYVITYWISEMIETWDIQNIHDPFFYLLLYFQMIRSLRIFFWYPENNIVDDDFFKFAWQVKHECISIFIYIYTPIYNYIYILTLCLYIYIPSINIGQISFQALPHKYWDTPGAGSSARAAKRCCSGSTGSTTQLSYRNGKKNGTKIVYTY